MKDIEFLHEMELGPVVSPERLTELLRERPDDELVLGLLQFLRNESAGYDLDAVAVAAEDRVTAGHLRQGAAQGLRDAALKIYGHLRLADPEE